MQTRDLSKLQIRAEVLLILQKLKSVDEMSKDQQDKCLLQLRSIRDVNHVLEVLVKELVKADSQKAQLISIFLQELGDLGSLQEVLWGYVKSPHTSDELKDVSGIILKSLGDQTDPEEFLNYFSDPKAIVDKETQKLLEVASVNPEAQIDFLDFLFTLPEQEQINLVDSLKEDYSSEYLVSVCVPALEARPSYKMQETLIRILGETRSSYAVKALTDTIKYSQSDFLKKLAQKSLSMLKLSGVKTDEAALTDYVAPITKSSDIYECHTNIVDGAGNQGFIISRIKPNKDILMMNVVINDVHGIIDCFGFYGISKQDFVRIIDKFQEMATRFIVSPEYCKYRLEKAEEVNKLNSARLPYEYAAWKSLITDVKPLELDFKQTCKKYKSDSLINETVLLYKFPDFQHWFLDEEDHPAVEKILKNAVDDLLTNASILAKNKTKAKAWLEEYLSPIFDEVFDHEIREIFRSRLCDITYLLDYQGLELFRDISASLAWCATPEYSYNLKTIPFFRELAKRTLLEGLIRHEYSQEQEVLPVVSVQERKKSPSAASSKSSKPPSSEKNKANRKDFSKIIDILSEL